MWSLFIILGLGLNALPTELIISVDSERHFFNLFSLCIEKKEYNELSPSKSVFLSNIVIFISNLLKSFAISFPTFP